MKLNDLRIGYRLGIGFFAVLLLMLAIVVTACLRLERTANSMKAMAALQDQARVAQEWRGKTQLNVTRAIAIAKAAGQPDIEQYFGPLIKRTTAEIAELQKTMEQNAISPEGKALMASVAQKRGSYVGIRGHMMELIKQADQPAVDTLLAKELMPAAVAYEAAMDEVQKNQTTEATRSSEQLQADIHTGENLLIVLLIAGLAVGAGMAWLITRSVTVPLREALQTARVIAASDLSQTVDSTRGDELGDLLRALGQMQASLRQLVGQVRSSTDSIGTASTQIASGNLDLSSRTEETASNLQETASSMAQLTDNVKNSADSARHASQLANSAAEVAERGGAVVSQVVKTMQGINESSRQIADIIGVIDSIAFQTNILALNAAVEAARAGEQGRGFAVVAGEVRLLAKRSADAAREIKTLIGASVERVEGGSKLVANAGETMKEIVGSVKRVSDIIQSITLAASEQSSGIGQINGAVSQLDQMTQQNAALVEESSAAAESLKEQAQRLSQVVGVFRLEAGAAHFRGTAGT